MIEGGGQVRTAPREVRIASTLLLILGVVMAVNALLALIFSDDLQRAAEEDATGLVSGAQIASILTVASIVLLVLGILLILAGVAVRRGRQWGRVLAFTGGGLVILLAATGAMAGAGIVAVFLLGASVGVVALLMQASVGPFFEPAPPGGQLPETVDRR